jgi:hypothetical protein
MAISSKVIRSTKQIAQNTAHIGAQAISSMKQSEINTRYLGVKDATALPVVHSITVDVEGKRVTQDAVFDDGINFDLEPNMLLSCALAPGGMYLIRRYWQKKTAEGAPGRWLPGPNALKVSYLGFDQRHRGGYMPSSSRGAYGRSAPANIASQIMAGSM